MPAHRLLFPVLMNSPPMLLTNDLKRHTAGLLPELKEAAERVLMRGWFVLGPEVEAFEREFAQWCGAAHCIGTGNGTDALELALRAAGIGGGHRVATVANAGMYSTTAILACGAHPVYIDIDPVTLNMAPEQLAAAGKVDAVVVTHLYGRMADVDAVRTAAPGAIVIEDCAQAHGASKHGKRAGTSGTAGCFSFYPTKNLGGCGDGGAVITSDDPFAQRVRALRQYGWMRRYHAEVSGGRNSRLDEMQAAFLRVKLPYVDTWTERRRVLARLLGTHRGFESSDAVHLCVVQHPERDRLAAHLRDRRIGADVHYPIPDYRQPAVVAAIGASSPLPNTEDACRSVLTLPCFPEMTDDEARLVRDAMLAFV